jgi:hypothetical protein
MGSMKLHPQAREIALRKVDKLRSELESSARPVSDQYLAKVAAEYVGAKVGDVLKWIQGR